MALNAFRRRSAALAGLLALALVVGPSASAACAHLGEAMPPPGPEAASHGTKHAEMAMPDASDDPMPCHETPEPVDEAPVSHDCASACCATDAPTSVPPALTVTVASAPAPATVAVAVPEAVAPVADVPPTPSPPRPTRLHVEIGRFLI